MKVFHDEDLGSWVVALTDKEASYLERGLMAIPEEASNLVTEQLFVELQKT